MNQPCELLVASRNAKKCAEISALLAPYNIEVRNVSEFPNVSEVIEDGNTFGKNAAKKATQTAGETGLWVLGEDSGLMVDALKGAPGIYSARYSDLEGDGKNATDEKNNQKLISELAGVPDEKRGAQYVCHVAISNPAGEIQLTEEATCRGRIVDEPRGSNGFGYDPHFLIREYGKTFGELSPNVKQHISHRARAFQRLIPRLVKLLLGNAN